MLSLLSPRPPAVDTTPLVPPTTEAPQSKEPLLIMDEPEPVKEKEKEKEAAEPLLIGLNDEVVAPQPAVPTTSHDPQKTVHSACAALTEHVRAGSMSEFLDVAKAIRPVREVCVYL